MRTELGVGFPGSPLFGSPNIMLTRGAQAALDESKEAPEKFLARHFHGDYGDIGEEDVDRNKDGIESRGMVLSSYKTSKGTKIWVITDPGHEVTTLLLPEDY